jgi:uncharacterized protein (DUF305 family)
MKVARFLLIAGFAMASATALAANDKISADDFVKKAGEAGAAEVAIHKGMKEKFEHQSADADFNHDFMEQMVKDHEAAVELFRTACDQNCSPLPR